MKNIPLFAWKALKLVAWLWLVCLLVFNKDVVSGVILLLWSLEDLKRLMDERL